MKVALVHDWLTGMRGGEKVLEIFCELYPEADIFTLLHVRGSVSGTIASHKITSSFLQHLPLVEKKYRYYLPIMPRAIESLDLKGYDLVISTSHCVAKGVIPDKNAVHVCCCFTPMRYIWDQYEHYFGPQSSLVTRAAMMFVRPYLQRWDVESSKRVTHFIAISKFVGERIKNFYGRGSEVIYPCADTDFYRPELGQPPSRNSKYYLMVSALAPYKRVDLAIEAFKRCGKPLKIIGSGQDEARLRAMARGNVEFLGWQPDEAIAQYYRNCKALIFPGIEDYGIVPIEVMACGKPVIAFRAGGTLETIAENKTGIFFNEQTPESLLQALETFESRVWDSAAIREHALKFSRERYKQALIDFLKGL